MTNCTDKPCGCNEDELTTLPNPCDTTECIDGEPCDVIIDCNCVRYSGPDIPEISVVTGDRVCDIIQKLMELGGIPGAVGNGIESTEYDPETGILTFTFTDETTFSTESLIGAAGNNGNYITVTTEAAGLNCETGGLKILLKDGITNATISTSYVCNGIPEPPLEFGAARAQSTPEDLDRVAPSYNGTRVFDGTIQLMTQIYDDDNAYDPVTGIWTCPTTGRYNLSFFIHFTRNDGVNGWYSSGGPGMFTAGVCSPTGSNVYCANTLVIPTFPLKHISMSGDALGMNITAGTQLCLKVMNASAYNYTSIVGDVVRLVVQRVK